jgi:hypothetical protein
MQDLKFIFNSASYAENEGHILTYRHLFESAFPDINEREDFNAIVKRVTTEPAGEEPHSFIILSVSLEGSETKVNGGLIADWYDGCPAIHLTYIVVDDASRGRNVAKILIRDGMEKMKAIIRDNWGAVLTPVFFESNSPWEQGVDSFNKSTRLLIFHKLGARWIDIPYVQPPLDASKKKVRTLFLMVFPDLNTCAGKVSQQETVDFLSKLYAGLGITRPEEDPDFQTMMKSLSEQTDEEGHLKLKTVPGEFPKYKFSKVSVTWHVIENLSEEQAGKKDREPCETFCSYERDLMNFQGQRQPPFSTRLIARGFDNQAIIKFPDFYEYISEGRKQRLFTNNPEINVNIALSCTNFHNSRIRIWSFTITPGYGEEFSEYDIIKLATLFSSRQENCNLKDNIRILTSPNGTEFKPESYLLKFGSWRQKPEFQFTGTGIIQIDSNETSGEGAECKDSFAVLYSSFSAKPEINTIFLEEKYNNDLYFRDLLNSMCGITLGIFDFNRMGSQEVTDTLRPINVCLDSFMILARGALISISSEDEILKEVYNTIGVSPYLLIPSVFLTFNEHIVSLGKKNVDSVLDNEPSSQPITKLEKSLRDSLNLSNKYLIPPFQYPTEQNIEREGNRQRNIEELAVQGQARREELKTIISQLQNERSAAISALISAALFLLSLIQVYQFFVPQGTDNPNYLRIYLILSILIVAGLFFLMIGKNTWFYGLFRRLFKRKRKLQS